MAWENPGSWVVIRGLAIVPFSGERSRRRSRSRRPGGTAWTHPYAGEAATVTCRTGGSQVRWGDIARRWWPPAPTEAYGTTGDCPGGLIEHRFGRPDKLSVVTTPPETRYAKTSDGLHIAYQVIGDGPNDLVVMHTGFSHLDMEWEGPVWLGSSTA